MMEIRCIWEHNGDDSILYAENYIGAFTRGGSLNTALDKMPQEIRLYLNWLGRQVHEEITLVVVQEKQSELKICDADSDVIFDTERQPLTYEEYIALKDLVVKSAADFYALYQSIPDKNISCLKKRDTFYGSVPCTAEEMYRHTKNVNDYYFGEIGVDANNNGSILDCRLNALHMLEKQSGYLESTVHIGSYGEEWSLRKVLRRFVWHDRIHAKAMWRMAVKTFGESSVDNVFCFE